MRTVDNFDFSQRREEFERQIERKSPFEVGKLLDEFGPETERLIREAQKKGLKRRTLYSLWKFYRIYRHYPPVEMNRLKSTKGNRSCRGYPRGIQAFSFEEGRGGRGLQNASPRGSRSCSR